MLKNDYLVVKIGVDTAENEPFERFFCLVSFLVFLSISAAAKVMQALLRAVFCIAWGAPERLSDARRRPAGDELHVCQRHLRNSITKISEPAARSSC